MATYEGYCMNVKYQAYVSKYFGLVRLFQILQSEDNQIQYPLVIGSTFDNLQQKPNICYF